MEENRIVKGSCQVLNYLFRSERCILAKTKIITIVQLNIHHLTYCSFAMRVIGDVMRQPRSASSVSSKPSQETEAVSDWLMEHRHPTASNVGLRWNGTTSANHIGRML